MSTLHFCTLDGGSPVADMLDLIARRAPVMMRCGGGALPEEKLRRPRTQHDGPVTKCEIERIKAIHRDGLTQSAIAYEMHRRTQTIGRVLSNLHSRAPSV